MIRLARGQYGTYVVEDLAADGTVSADILVQTDYDFPGIAGTFGWFVGYVPVPDAYPYAVGIGDFRSCPNEHDSTDGTVSCRVCGATAADFISSAAEWLDSHIGAMADDPGYFPAVDDLGIAYESMTHAEYAAARHAKLYPAS
jgi:hypothetical protein